MGDDDDLGDDLSRPRVHQFTPPESPREISSDDDDESVTSGSWRATSSGTIGVILSGSSPQKASRFVRSAEHLPAGTHTNHPPPIVKPMALVHNRAGRARSRSEGAKSLLAPASPTGAAYVRMSPSRTPPQSQPPSPPLTERAAFRDSTDFSADSSTSLVSPISPNPGFQWDQPLVIPPDVGLPMQKPSALAIRPEPARFGLIESQKDHQMLTGSSGSHHLGEIGFERSEKELGSGAYGKVWLGLRDNGEFLAIKEIQIAPNEKYSARLEAVENEIELMRTLDHPHIVRYLGSKRDEVRGAFYILLEYVSCGSIQVLLKTMGGPLDERVIRKYARQILLGLAYLHSRNPPVAHRDIKSANVLVETTGNVKLADFGCSKVLNELLEGEETYDSVLGTPHWMAPEVIRQEGAGLPADIWSFGCTVLEMASGKPPWSHIREPTAVLFHIAAKEEIPQIPDSLSEEGKDFLRRCFQRDPSKRPTAAELLQHAFVSTDHVGTTSLREERDSEEYINSLMVSQSLSVMPQFLSVLPPHLVVYIFQFLPVQDLCSVAAVCRHWRTAASSDILWQVKAQQQWPWLTSSKGNRWRDVYVQGTSRLSWRKRNLTLDTLRGHSRAVTCLDARGASDRLVTGGEDKKIRLWSVSKHKCVLTFRGHTRPVSCVRFDDARVASGGGDCVVRLWDINKGKLLRTIDAHPKTVRGVELLSTSVVSCSTDGTRVWDMETGTALSNHLSSVVCNSVRSDMQGSRILVACQDGTLRMCDLRSNRPAADVLLAGHADAVTCVQWGRATSGNGGGAAPTSISVQDIIASSSMDATVRLWDIRSAQRALSVLRPTGWEGPLYAVDMDDSVVAAGGRDRVLHVWDLASEELMRQLKNHHTDTITGVAVGQEKCIFSCSRDKNVRVLRQERDQSKGAAFSLGGFLRLPQIFHSSPTLHSEDSPPK